MGTTSGLATDSRHHPTRLVPRECGWLSLYHAPGVYVSILELTRLLTCSTLPPLYLDDFSG